jgi:predicted acetyltransferase
MEQLYLVRPSADYTQEISDYRQEFLEEGIDPCGAGPLGRKITIEDYLEKCRLYVSWDGVPEGRVPSTQFFCVKKDPRGTTSDGMRIVGMINARHCLNDELLNYSGHIGYSVRKDERRKGYAKWMLTQCLAFYKEQLGISKVLITCGTWNEASRRTILSCGGVYEDTRFCQARNESAERYWIQL